MASDNIDADKLAALEALLRQERERRFNEKIAKGEVEIITGVPDADDETPIVVAPETSPSVEDFGARKHVSEALHVASNPPPSTPLPASHQYDTTPAQGPVRIIVQTQAPDPERNDPGTVEEGSYSVTSGGIVLVEDAEGRLIGSEVLRPGDDAKSVARAILRSKTAPNDFWGRTLH
jgi:hypothetical protein